MRGGTGKSGWTHAAVPAEGPVLQDARSPGPYPDPGAAERTGARGRRAAARGRYRARAPAPAARRAAAREPGRDPQGGLGRPLLADQPAHRRAAGCRARHPLRCPGRPGRVARRPAGHAGRGEAAVVTTAPGRRPFPGEGPTAPQRSRETAAFTRSEAHAFGGSVQVRCVDAGSRNGCEIEIAAASTTRTSHFNRLHPTQTPQNSPTASSAGHDRPRGPVRWRDEWTDAFDRALPSGEVRSRLPMASSRQSECSGSRLRFSRPSNRIGVRSWLRLRSAHRSGRCGVRAG